MNAISGSKGGFNKKLLAIPIVVIIIVVLVVSWQLYWQPSSTKSNVTLPALNLTLVGANTHQKNLTASDMSSLRSYSSTGGYVDELGNVTFGNYTGVPMRTLLNLVGGINSNDNVTVKASDGYHVTFTYDQIQGQNLNAYNASTRSPTQPTEPLTMIVAYYCNHTALPSSKGPLTIAIVGPQGLYTPGRYWVYLLDEIQVITG